jgi:hypothetical protein
MPELMLHLGGESVRLADCFWVRFGPNGCAYGSLVGDSAVNEEQAHAELVPRQRDRDRDQRQGYRIELLTRKQWRAQAGPCFLGECSH